MSNKDGESVEGRSVNSRARWDNDRERRSACRLEKNWKEETQKTGREKKGLHWKHVNSWYADTLKAEEQREDSGTGLCCKAQSLWICVSFINSSHNFIRVGELHIKFILGSGKFWTFVLTKKFYT